MRPFHITLLPLLFLFCAFNTDISLQNDLPSSGNYKSINKTLIYPDSAIGIINANDQTIIILYVNVSHVN